ncbi:MAG TPA: hypothetical protein EYP59_22320 [Thiotrichaceae bacterium]|nr:hypothetical protein [Thiotrichaceae bacterium]
MKRGAIFKKLIGDKGGGWTIKWGKMSVCECAQTGGCSFDAGPIWNQADAETKCPKTCDSQGGWNGQWWTTVEGKMSVCGCKACK